MRGPGETQLEVDRRIVKDRIRTLSQKIKKLSKDRELRRQKRREGALPIISIVGYTNAGKSSLLNALSGSHEYTDDRLFATLDPVTRRVKIKDNLWVLVTDTVGFVQKLPHQLVASFHSTLEEMMHSDLLIHVIDMHHGQLHNQEEEVRKVIKEMGADQLPCIMVYNKMDLQEGPMPSSDGNVTYVSATKGSGIDELKHKIEKSLENLWPVILIELPLKEGKIRSEIYEKGSVLNEKTKDGFVFLSVRLPKEMVKRFSAFVK